MRDLRGITPPKRILGVGGATPVIGQGTVRLPITVEGHQKNFEVCNVLVAPGLPFNIISVKCLCQHSDGSSTDLYVSFAGSRVEIIRRSTGALVAVGSCIGTDLYRLTTSGPAIGGSEHAYAAAVVNQVSLLTWHYRLGHLKESRLRRALRRSLGITFPPSESLYCKACLQATLPRNNYRTPGERVQEPFARIHLDVGGPIFAHHEGKKVDLRYYLLITDDYTRHRWAYLMNYKSDVVQVLRSWIEWIKNRFKANLRAARMDNGGEFDNRPVRTALQEIGVEFEWTAPHNPEQNGVAERSNRTLMESVRSILAGANLPKSCFGEILKTAVLLMNYAPTSANGDVSPHEQLFGTPPPLSRLRAVGCECWKPTTRGPSLTKLADRGHMCYLLGFGKGEHMYRVWNTELKKVELVRDLHFKEDRFCPDGIIIPPTVGLPALALAGAKRSASFEGENSNAPAKKPRIPATNEVEANKEEERWIVLINSKGDFNEEHRVKDPTANPEQTQRQILALRAVVDQPNPEPAISMTQIAALVCSLEKYQDKQWLALAAEAETTFDLMEPKTYAAAMQSPQAKKWWASIEDEIRSLIENRTWDITSAPEGVRVLSGKFVFKIKTDAEGKASRYKSRWVVRGFEQEYGVDFQETFASVVKPMSYKVLFALGCKLGWHIDQMDVKTAFLYGDIDAEVYVELPPNLKDKYPGKVCKLRKALYGLKQAPKIWFETLSKELEKLGFQASAEDYSIFVKEGVIIAVYVDDLLVMGPDRAMIDEVKAALAKRFQMQDMGPASYYLGIKLSQHRTRWGTKLCLSQAAYVSKILRDFGMQDSTPVTTPMENKTLEPGPADYIASAELCKWYQSAIGSLMYLMLCTRPDIAYAISQLSRFAANPTENHKGAVKRVFRYLAGTRNWGLVFDTSQTGGLLGFTDANWGRDNDKRSTGGYVFTVFGTAVSWSSKRQATVALSSCEAEYMAETEAAKEAIWLRRLVRSFGIDGLRDQTLGGVQGALEGEAVTILGDNRGALALAKNPEFHSRSKHIDIRYHFVRQKVREGLVKLAWIETSNNISDIMTKPLGRVAFEKLRYAMGMRIVAE